MRLLVTGGSGFIGSNFIEYALSEDSSLSIMNVDSLTYASIFKTDFKSRFGRRYQFCKADILQTDKIAELCRDTDMVVHFAAETHVDNSISAPKRFARTNVLGTASILEAVRKTDHERFLHISTDEVYGSASGKPFKETDSLVPSSPYSASKAGAEMMVLAYEKTYGLKATITRSSNNYGPRQHPEKFIPRIITRLMSGRKIPVYGRGKNIRDWIYVKDSCEAIMLLLKGRHSGAYNISSGVSMSNVDLAREVIRIMGKQPSDIQFVDDRKGHDFKYSINSSKIRSLGWNPRTDFKSGIRKTIEWYAKCESAWRKHIV
jgi:dTDP-glucose 4,6-dehydratase